MNTLLLTVSLALAAPPPVPSVPLLSAASAEPYNTRNQDYAAGYALGAAHGSQIRNVEWFGYGVAAGCVGGPAGCLAVTAIGFMVDPQDLPPRDTSVAVPGTALAAPPPPPLSIADPQSWILGYEEGWDSTVQHDRAVLAFLGGSVLPVMVTTFYVTYVVSVLVVLGTI